MSTASPTSTETLTPTTTPTPTPTPTPTTTQASDPSPGDTKKSEQKKVTINGKTFAITDAMRHEARISLPKMSSRTVYSLSVLGAGVAIGLLQYGKFGTGVFSYQAAGYLATICTIPSVYRMNRDGVINLARIPKFSFFLLFATWMMACGASVSYYVLLDLFTGHQKPGAQWYDALWRIYAILCLWMMFAIVNEKYLRPIVRHFTSSFSSSSSTVAGANNNESIAAQGQRLAEEERKRTLDRMLVRMGVVLRRKERLQQKKLRLERELATSPSDEKQAELDEVSVDLADMTDKLELLKADWTDAQHISNYQQFYR